MKFLSVMPNFFQPSLNLLGPIIVMLIMLVSIEKNPSDIFQIFTIANNQKFSSDIIVMSLPVSIIASISSYLHFINYSEFLKLRKNSYYLLVGAICFLNVLFVINFGYWARSFSMDGTLIEGQLSSAKLNFWMSLIMAFSIELFIGVRETIFSRLQETQLLMGK